MKSLVLTATSAKMPEREKFVLETLLLMAKAGVSQELISRSTLPWLLSTKFFERAERVQMALDSTRSARHPQPPHALARQLVAGSSTDTHEENRRIRAPTLVLEGNEDILCPPEAAEELAASIPNAEIAFLEGGGHESMLEIPDKFNAAAMRFLERQE